MSHNNKCVAGIESDVRRLGRDSLTQVTIRPELVSRVLRKGSLRPTPTSPQLHLMKQASETRSPHMDARLF